MTALRFVSSMHSSPRQVRIYEYTAMERSEMNKMFYWLCNKLIIYFICGKDAEML